MKRAELPSRMTGSGARDARIVFHLITVYEAKKVVAEIKSSFNIDISSAVVASRLAEILEMRRYFPARLRRGRV
jgi:hypothetical protein